MYLHLKEIIIHDCNFSTCRAFLLSNLPLLRTLIVGDNSFNLYGGQRAEAPFSITNCPSLTTITIGDSFHKYTSFFLSGEALLLACEHRLWSTSVLHYHFQQVGLFLSCNRTVFVESFILALVTHRSSFSWTHFDWTQLLCECEDGCVWELFLMAPIMNRSGFVEIDWAGYKGVPWR